MKGRQPGKYCIDSTLRAGVHHVLQAEPCKWADWVALGTVELADLVDSQLTEIADWELNLKMLKVQLIILALKESDCRCATDCVWGLQHLSCCLHLHEPKHHASGCPF